LPVVSSTSMALVTINAEQKTEAFAKAGPDLKFLLDKKDIDEELQGLLYHVGVTSVELLAAFAKNQDDLEAALKTYFGIDGTADVASRLKVARVVVAWNAAKARAVKHAEVDAECEVNGQPKELPQAEAAAMRKAFEKAWWELDDKAVPAKSYLQKILDRVEKDDLVAEPLSEVLTIPEDDPDTLKAVWTLGNELKAVKVGTKVSLPRDAEELRKRVGVLGTAWMMVAYQQTHKAYLRGLTPQTFAEYLEYLLGDFVMGLCAKDASGRAFAHPSWALVVAYEFAIRVRTMQLIRKGKSFKTALKESWEDAVIKERYFTTPLCLEQARKRPLPVETWEAPQDPPDKRRKEKGGKKGKGKGKGKGKNVAPSGCASTTPDNRPICFNYNNKAKRCKANGCRFLHVCGQCFKPNFPMYACDHKP